jgi:hypothetical protein
MSTSDRRAVFAAQQSVAARKATIAAQWSALETRVRNGVTSPTTLGAVALVGGVMGWRSAMPEKRIEVKCECPKKERSSALGGTMRALAIAALQAGAAIASEEFLRSVSEPTAENERRNGTGPSS